jgi:hypothetical protein
LTVTDVLAVIGAATGTFALVWDFIKWWFSERVYLEVRASPNMNLTTDVVKVDYVMIVVRNKGKFTTTLTLLSFEVYKSWWQFKRGKRPTLQSIVPNPNPGVLPHVLEPGKEWMGLTQQNNEELTKYKKYKYVTCSIHHSMGKPAWDIVKLPQ